MRGAGTTTLNEMEPPEPTTPGVGSGILPRRRSGGGIWAVRTAASRLARLWTIVVALFALQAGSGWIRDMGVRSHYLPSPATASVTPAAGGIGALVGHTIARGASPLGEVSSVVRGLTFGDNIVEAGLLGFVIRDLTARAVVPAVI